MNNYFIHKNLYIIIFLLAVHYFNNEAIGESSYYSYETKVNSIDDGQRVWKVEESTFDSSKSERPKTVQKVVVAPSRYGSFNNLISRQQVASNKVGTGLDTTPSGRFEFLRRRVANAFSDDGYKEFTRPRTVESPALSVDSGGQFKNGNLVAELAKLFNVKQGYYTDVYDKL